MGFAGEPSAIHVLVAINLLKSRFGLTIFFSLKCFRSLLCSIIRGINCNSVLTSQAFWITSSYETISPSQISESVPANGLQIGPNFPLRGADPARNLSLALLAHVEPEAQ